MAQLLILGLGMAWLGGMIPVVPDKSQRDFNDPTQLFSKSREDGVQPTRDRQKRSLPVNKRAQGNAYNDAPLSIVSSNSQNMVYTSDFKQIYSQMKHKDRLRPSEWLVKHWPTPVSHMQGTQGDTYYGSSQTLGAGDQKIPIEFRTDYVPARYAPAFTPYNRYLNN